MNFFMKLGVSMSGRAKRDSGRVEAVPVHEAVVRRALICDWPSGH